LSFGEATNYKTAGSMENHTRHTRGENIRRIREEKKVDKLVVDMINNRIFDKKDQEKVLIEANKERLKGKFNKEELQKSRIIFGTENDEKDDADEKYRDYIPKNRSVAREAMLVKGDNNNDVERWRREAKEKKRVLQSTSKGMRLLDEDVRTFETESRAAAKRMTKNQKAGEWKQERYTGGKRGPHHKDSVGKLLLQDEKFS